MMNTKAIAILCSLLWLSSANADITYELRSPIGATLARPSGLNDINPAPLQIKYGGNFGADALVDFDLPSLGPSLGAGLGVGVRFDSISAVRADGALKDGDAIEVANHIFSLLLRKRFAIDESRYVAINSSVAFYAPSSVNTHAANGSWVQYKTSHLGQFSVGAEGGWIWDPFLVAAEVGYQSVYMNDLTNDAGAHLVDTDMSGPYLKAILGLRFR